MRRGAPDVFRIENASTVPREMPALSGSSVAVSPVDWYTPEVPMVMVPEDILDTCP
jgi:hypothetical protein